MADVNFRDIINNFRNVGGAQAVVSNIKFQQELFKLEQTGVPLPNRVREFQIPHVLVASMPIEKLRFTIMKIENQKQLVSIMVC